MLTGTFQKSDRLLETSEYFTILIFVNLVKILLKDCGSTTSLMFLFTKQVFIYSKYKTKLNSFYPQFS